MANQAPGFTFREKMSGGFALGETDPETGDKRWYHASRFAGEWSFKSKGHRRDNWTKTFKPTRAMWEHVLEALKLRLPRREQRAVPPQ